MTTELPMTAQDPHLHPHPQGETATTMASRRARLEAWLFTAASLGTTLVTLGLLGDVKIPRAQSE
jgi:hypothetical protein